MKTAPINKISIFILLLIITFLQISCTKKSEDFIEFTYGLSMDPEFPRAGIKIKSDNYVYYCEEIINKGDKYYLNNQTGKYKFYKSEEKIKFSKYKELVIKNFSEKIHKNYISIADATYEQIDFKLDSKKIKQGFFNVQLNQNQRNIQNEIWKLKNKLKFKSIDSIYFNQERLQEKLPEPPPLNK
ncbi:hypothetical protein NZD85_06365 [Empedobacter stercoris]|uniref:hypothetical protein n=1 Tax=Empedobacter stercoris TaxID=1628248 RepID=UPI0021AECAF2|nr:hypothetical protein [Empedobacter stercoris]UWX68216.1 hypothetical protein NZD85_06365 [Empedobacter stercoris]